MLFETCGSEVLMMTTSFHFHRYVVKLRTSCMIMKAVSDAPTICHLVVIGIEYGRVWTFPSQCGSRNHLLSQEIAWAHEEQQQVVLQEQTRGAQQLQEELKFVNEDMEVIPATSSKRMSLVDTPATVDKGTQVNILAPPPIRKCRNAMYEIKDTIATVSCKAAITLEKARIATKVVCENFMVISITWNLHMISHQMVSVQRNRDRQMIIRYMKRLFLPINQSIILSTKKSLFKK